MKMAVVDIGSNAVRSTFYGIDKIHGDEIMMKKLSYLRLPIRLGEDVFTETAEISADKFNKMLSMAHAFKHLCMIHDVTDYRIVATSAMREAKNAQLLIDLIRIQKDLEIEIIDGEEEAELISESLFSSDCIKDDGCYMLIDVGGGSTEITFFQKGETKASRSFKLGSVRCKEKLFDQPEWVTFQEWIMENSAKYKPREAIGTGGNINRLHKLNSLKKSEALDRTQIRESIDYLNKFTYKELLEEVKLKSDRADVIIPASEIYYMAMVTAGLEKIVVPKVGLAEGVARKLFRTHMASEV